MATLQELIRRLGGVRPATRALKYAGINQPNGRPLGERLIREGTKGRERGTKGRVTPGGTEAHINRLIRNTPYEDLPDPGEEVVPSGSETHGTLLSSKKGGWWIGEDDAREFSGRELSKYELRKLLMKGDRRRTWEVDAFGVFQIRGKYGPLEGSHRCYVFEEEADDEGSIMRRWGRHWLRVAQKLGRLLFDPRTRAASSWQETETQVRVEETAARRAAADQARIARRGIDQKALNIHLLAIRRGGTYQGIFYPSFAARYCTEAGDREWRHVYAASLRHV